MSKSLRAFTDTAERVIRLVEHSKQHRQTHPDDSALCDDQVRAGIVLAVAAMDSYFTRKFSEMLVPYLKRHGPSNRLSGLLREAGLDTEQALIMLTMERPYRRVRSLIRSHLARYTTQHFAKIDELFHCFGLPHLCEHAERKSQRKTLRQSVRLLVQRRNQISHEGDLNNAGKLQALNLRVVERRVRDVQLFVKSADEIIEAATKPRKGGQGSHSTKNKRSLAKMVKSMRK